MWGVAPSILYINIFEYIITRNVKMFWEKIPNALYRKKIKDNIY